MLKQTFLALLLLSLLSSRAHTAILQGPNQNDPSLVALVTDMSDDGSIFIAATYDMELTYYKVDENGSMTLVHALSASGFMEDMDVSPDGSMVGFAGNNTAMIYNVTNTALVSFQNISLSMNQMIKSISFSSDLAFLILGESSGKVLLYKLSGTYASFENITENSKVITRIAPINRYFVTGGEEKILKVYKIGATSSSLLQSLNTGKIIQNIRISSDQTHIYALLSDALRIYQGSNGNYAFSQELALTETAAVDVIASGNHETIITGGSSGVLELYTLQDSGNYALNETNNVGNSVSSLSSDDDLLIIKVFTSSETLGYFMCSDTSCLSCSNPALCLVCVNLYTLENGVCIIFNNNTNNSTNNNNNQVNPTSSPCVDGKTSSTGECIEYCSEKCSSCMGDKNNCTKCADFYKKNSQGVCESTVDHDLLKFFRSFFQIVKNKPIKVFFMLIGDLRFYEYHKREYTGDFGQFIRFMRFVEDKQWDIIKYGELGDAVDDLVEQMPSYKQYSNKKYQRVERRDEFFFRGIYEYLFYSLPMTIIIMILLNKIFYLLFKVEISKYLRMFSFWGYLFELAIQSNIQVFSFLAFRQFLQPISFNFQSKVCMALFILSFWIIVVFTIASYYMYYYLYGRLSKYFLVNNYRIKSAFTSNMLVYGIRPFVKGVIHSLCYDNYELQISLLLAIEICTLVILSIFQSVYHTHRKKIVLYFEMGVYGAFAFLDFMLLLTYVYKLDMPEVLTNILYVLSGLVLCRLIFDMIPNRCSDEKIELGNKKKQKQKQKQKTKSKKDIQTTQQVLQDKNIFDFQFGRKNTERSSNLQIVPDELEHAAIKRIKNSTHRKGQIIMVEDF